MPSYDYKCAECSHVFERVHGMTETPQYECPVCGSTKVEKQMSFGGGIIFKGSGFHINDYGQKPAAEKSESSAATATAEKKESNPNHSSGHVCHGNCKH